MEPTGLPVHNRPRIDTKRLGGLLLGEPKFQSPFFEVLADGLRTNGKKATRPCPCGWLGDARGRCHCTPDRITRYRSRVSGPLLDRIDLTLEVPSLGAEALAMRKPRAVTDNGNARDAAEAYAGPDPEAGESSAAIRSRVVGARDRQRERQGKPNARLLPSEIAQHCWPDAAGEALLAQAMARLAFSARAYHRILKVARTIADLAGAAAIAPRHIAEAVSYRGGDSRPQ
jgi:magnesium chelatase family protein